ncbi:MAG: (Fe-S)-binding protein, partial [Halodesulfurarchaeum sp.]|nr:(Fe-S)-binding protein [Halodesulfurarchaeum sp.]
YSKALIETARETARNNVGVLASKVRAGWDILSVEPSASVMFQEDYNDLLSGPNVQTVADNTYSVFEYLDVFGLEENLDVRDSEETVTYHGNCIHKGTGRDTHVTEVLERLGFAVDELDSTCCGMAGSFGYEAEHYSMSTTLMSLLEGQIESSPGDDVVVTGASCTMQIGDMPSREAKPDHAVTRLAELLR